MIPVSENFTIVLQQSHITPVEASVLRPRVFSTPRSSVGISLKRLRSSFSVLLTLLRIHRCRSLEYSSAGHSSAAATSAGRHSWERDLRMKVISEGVKGLLRTRRESFVV